MMKETTFEECMALEVQYMKREFAAVAAQDYRAAEHFHILRWRCMDAAVKIAQKAGNQ